MSDHLKYINGYPDELIQQTTDLIKNNRLKYLIETKYPQPEHSLITNDKSLYKFTIDLKNKYLKSSPPLSKVTFDKKVSLEHYALGLHSNYSRVQGNKLKSKRQIQIADIFKTAPEQLLRVVVVHELAHLKVSEHNKAFYKLCQHMEPEYHQLEFDMRLWLTAISSEEHHK